MAAIIHPEQTLVVDPFGTEVLSINGICPPEDFGSILHVPLFQYRRSRQGQIEHVIVQRVAITHCDFAAAVEQAMRSIGRQN